MANAVNQRLALVRGLAAFIAVKARENNPFEIEKEFGPFASAYFDQVAGIRNISVAPDFVVKHVYPTDPGNLKVIGNRIQEDRRPGFAATVARAITSRGLALHEPVELIQGGIGLVARHAIFVDDHPWGAVGMAFSIPTLLDGSRIPPLDGFEWGLRTGTGMLVGGNGDVFARNPLVTRIDLPDGYWDFALAPKTSWRALALQGVEAQALRILLVLLGGAVLWGGWNQIRRRQIFEHLAEAQNAELGRANNALGRFSFVVAHHLQEPLRAILTQSQLITRASPETLTPEQRDSLGQLSAAAQRMKGLLHDVQIYLGESEMPLPRRPCLAVEAVAIAQRKLSAQIRSAGAVITVGPLPEVMADLHRLSEIFTALLSNAIEYRKPDQDLAVSISATREDGFYIIHVTDNGIGIETAYMEKIFEVFQRLHSRGDHPGTGMGLAIVRKMVEHLGGAIVVASEPGVGSTFSIRLPIDGTAKGL